MLWIKFSLALPGDWLPNCSSDVLIFDHRLPVGSWSKGEVFLFLAGSWSHRTWHHRKQTGGKRKKKYKQLYNFKSKRNINKQQESRSSIHIYCTTSLFPNKNGGTSIVYTFIYLLFFWIIYLYICFSIRPLSTNQPSPTGTFSSWWCLHHGEHLAGLGRGSEAKQRRRPLRPPREVLPCFFFVWVFWGVLKCVWGISPDFSETSGPFQGGGCYFWLGVVHYKMLDEVGKFHGGSMAFKKWCGWWMMEAKHFHDFLLGDLSHIFYFHPENGGNDPIWLLFKWVGSTPKFLVGQVHLFHCLVFDGSGCLLHQGWGGWLKETSNGTWNKTSYR